MDEAITVLSRAVSFFSTQATDRLNYMISSSSEETVYRSKPFPVGSQPYDDVEQAITLGNRLISMQEARGVILY